MTPADLEAFQRRMKWRRNRLGEELDISQNRLRRMLDGLVPIPRHIELACAALEVLGGTQGPGRAKTRVRAS